MFAEDASFRERFQREAHLAASIDHPNVIPVYEAGEREGTLYLIMRWVEGTELRALLRAEGRLSAGRAIELLRPVASALAAAHRRGLVHRDVKPANVLIARGEGEDEHVYLTDFGIARRLDSEGGVTRTGALVGTLDYIAPERIEGGRGDAAADIYSFGCMLYEALTGSLPYDRPTELGKMHAHVHEPVPSVRDAVPDVPPALDAIVARAMAKDPAHRFASAGELANALTAAGDPGAVTAERRARVEADTDETDLPATDPVATEVAKVVARAEPARTRTTGLLAGLGLLAVAAVVAVVLLTGGGGADGKGDGSASPTGSAAPKATGDGHADSAPVFQVTGGRPAGLATSGDLVWVTVPAAGRILGFATGRPTKSIEVGGAPRDVVGDPRGRVWVTNTGNRAMTVYDPAAGRATRIPTGADPGPLALTDHAGWVVDRGENAVTRVDAATLRARRIALPGRPTGVAAAYGRAWIALAGGAVRVLDENGRPDAVASPPVAGRIVAGGGSLGVWFAGAVSGARTALTRIDPRRSAAHRTGRGLVYDAPKVPPPLAGAPRDLSVGSVAMWLAAGSRVVHLDTTGGTVRETGAVGFPAPVGDIALRGGTVWVAIPGTGRIYRLVFPASS